MTIQELVKQASSIEANEWMLPLLWGIARMCKNGVLGEIGFKDGSSALALCMGAREGASRVYSMDIAACKNGLMRIEREGYADIHTFIEGDSARVEFPEELDLLFIDGNHDYPDVARDYERHGSRVKKGGVILFHDPVSCPEIGRFLNERKIPYFHFGSGLGMEVVR